MALVLEAEHLSRTIKGREVLQDVSFRVERHGTVAVTGPSGSGKTTLLRLLVRLDEPDQGMVRFHGADIKQMEPRELRRRVAYVSQDPVMLPGTVMENLAVGPRLAGRDPDPERARKTLDLLGLAGREEDAARDLSAGQRLRLALARALQNDPEVLLLDEPTAKLDDAARERVESLLGALQQETGVAIVIVSHDNGQAGRLGDQVVRLKTTVEASS